MSSCVPLSLGNEKYLVSDTFAREMNVLGSVYIIRDVLLKEVIVLCHFSDASFTALLLSPKQQSGLFYLLIVIHNIDFKYLTSLLETSQDAV